MRLVISTPCGEKTCAESPGNFCGFVRSYCFGQKYWCNFYDQPLHDNKDGWLKRCPDCLEYGRYNETSARKKGMCHIEATVMNKPLIKETSESD